MEGKARVEEVKVLQDEIEDYVNTYGVTIEQALKLYKIYYLKKIVEKLNP